MVVCILLVHGVASHFGLKLKYLPLLSCGLFAMAINFIAIRTTPFLGKMLLFKIIFLILIASLLSSFLNRFLIRREQSKNAQTKVERKAITRVLPTEQLDTLPLPSTEEEAVKRRVDEIKASKVKPPIETPQSKSLVKLVKEDQRAEKKSVERKVEPLRPSTVINPVELNKKVKPPRPSTVLPTVDLNKKVDVAKKVEPVRPSIAAPAVELDKKTAVSGLVTANEKLSAVIDKAKSNKPASGGKPSFESRFTEEEIQSVESHLNSLDEILDFAYAQKAAGNLKLSILAYQKALERYRGDNYAPFIAIDLSSIYKEQAAYSKAIRVCEDALTLPAVVRSPSARKDFSNSLAYLRTVQSVLSRHRVLATPFSKIPRRLLTEIDADFKKLTVLS